MTIEGKMYTTDEVSRILKISRSTVYRLMMGGHLKWHQIGNMRRVSESQLEDYLRISKNDNQN